LNLAPAIETAVRIKGEFKKVGHDRLHHFAGTSEGDAGDLMSPEK
jgi:hypothetical protein